MIKIHIGELIQKRAKELRIGPTELSRMINTSRANIYWIYKRKYIDVEMLTKLSRALEFNFFNLYTDSEVLGKTNLKLENLAKPANHNHTKSSQTNIYQEVAELKEKYLTLAQSLKKGKKK